MKALGDVFGNLIEMTDERWDHVCEQHPELKSRIKKVVATLQDPDIVKASRSDRSVRLYCKYFDNLYGGKYILVVVKSNKRHFLITAYITDYIKAGGELWRRRD